MLEKKYKHFDAFRLLTYQNPVDPNDKETIWNSRDGITPFTITAKNGDGKLQLSDRKNEPVVPFYTPKIGERVFIDMTPEISMQLSRRWLQSLIDAAISGTDGAKQALDSIEQQCIEEILDRVNHFDQLSDEQKKDPLSAYRRFLNEHSKVKPGEPALVVVDQHFIEMIDLLWHKNKLKEREEQQKSLAALVRFDGSNALPISVPQLIKEALDNSKKKGFFPVDQSNNITFVNVVEKLCMIHSEISEALEVYRARESEDLTKRWKSIDGKPEGFGSELSDAVIRIAGLAGALGIDLNLEIKEKMDYNKTRPYQHGKKYGER